MLISSSTIFTPEIFYSEMTLTTMLWYQLLWTFQTYAFIATYHFRFIRDVPVLRQHVINVFAS